MTNGIQIKPIDKIKQRIAKVFERKNIALHHTDEMEWYEKWTMFINAASSAFNIFTWAAGAALAAQVSQGAIEWLTIIIAIAAGVSLDATVIVTMMGKREGRNGLWTHLTAIGATVFAVMIAIQVHGGYQFGAALHAVNAVNVYLLMQHFGQRKVAPKEEWIQIGLFEALKQEYEALKLSAKAELESMIKDWQTKYDSLKIVAQKHLDESSATIETLRAENKRLESEAEKAKENQSISDKVLLEFFENGGLTLNQQLTFLAAQGKNANQISLLLGTSAQNVLNWQKKLAQQKDDSNDE